MFAIEARQVSKAYRIYASPKDRLKEFICRGRRSYHQPFWAIRDVSLQIKTGSTIGLIGDNGAGKSTLLQLVAGVLRPTAGQVTTHGMISTILELGTGFNHEFTGRENAMMSGTILGIPPQEMEQRLSEIADFAEIGDFFDRPIKIYSSGMYVRLAFAVATSVDPDILIVDEALAVGDQYFQKRCIDRIERFRKAGKTILFCSHSLYQVRMVCSEAIWLKDGQVAKAGDTASVIAAYENYLRERDAPARSLPAVERAPQAFPWISQVLVGRRSADRSCDQFVTGEDLVVSVDYCVPNPPTPVHVGICIDRNDAVQVFGTATHVAGTIPFPTGGRVCLRLPRLPLLSGQYTVTVFLLDEHGLHVYDRLERQCPFNVVQNIQAAGLALLPHQWELEAECLPAAAAVPATRHAGA
ncbi:MAG: ABC transporter ATP-binding protein [bacterium]|uniref:ABC transporter ATP-binding protein n=1 Tax=Candidatus Methylomirabilis tolerans TaxID=3123416 RepID=A0AAJ1EHV7_9BACT|nr:ABC transporter ATP-binding protein [Candidatus Methylomirabilis sp.]